MRWIYCFVVAIVIISGCGNSNNQTEKDTICNNITPQEAARQFGYKAWQIGDFWFFRSSDGIVRSNGHKTFKICSDTSITAKSPANVYEMTLRDSEGNIQLYTSSGITMHSVVEEMTKHHNEALENPQKCPPCKCDCSAEKQSKAKAISYLSKNGYRVEDNAGTIFIVRVPTNKKVLDELSEISMVNGYIVTAFSEKKGVKYELAVNQQGDLLITQLPYLFCRVNLRPNNIGEKI